MLVFYFLCRWIVGTSICDVLAPKLQSVADLLLGVLWCACRGAVGWFYRWVPCCLVVAYLVLIGTVLRRGCTFEIARNVENTAFLKIVLSPCVPRFLCCPEVQLLYLNWNYSKQIVPWTATALHCWQMLEQWVFFSVKVFILGTHLAE